MEYKSIKGFTGFGQLGLLIGFVGAGFILMAVALVPFLAGTADLKQVDVNTLRISQVIGTFFLFCVPAVAYSLIANGKNLFWLGFSKYLNVLSLIVAFGIIYMANWCAGPLADLTKSVVAHFPSLDATAKKVEDAYTDQILTMSNLRSWGEYGMALVIMAFFPAMFEELFFRGAIQNLLVKWWQKPALAIVVSSVIFSLVHMSIYLFLSRVVLGLALGILFHKGKNIWINIIAHFLNNAIALTLLFVMSRKHQTIDLSKIDPKVGWYVGVAGLIGMIILFAVFERVSRNDVARISAKESILISNDDPFKNLADSINNN